MITKVKGAVVTTAMVLAVLYVANMFASTSGLVQKAIAPHPKA